MTMDELKPKQSAFIRSVGGTGALRHHLLDMGLTPKTEVTLQKIAPMGDPVQIELRGYELTKRKKSQWRKSIQKRKKTILHKGQWQWNIRESVNLEGRTAIMFIMQRMRFQKVQRLLLRW